MTQFKDMMSDRPKSSDIYKSLLHMCANYEKTLKYTPA